MFDELNYVIWYHKIFGKTNRGRKALAYYGGYENLYDAAVAGYDESGFLNGISPSKYTSFSLIDTEKILEDCAVNNWFVIPCTSPEYPRMLLGTDDYPHILFCDGKKEILTRNVMFSVVGSRNTSEANEIAVYDMAYSLAKAGAVIVSGAAVGIDSAAHLGAVRAGGYTVGVLGCGLGNSYMDRIGSFYDEILSSGVYITEMFPFENATKGSFPDRNRIISGMSRALLVACADENSGTLNTAGHAKKQNRRIFVPDSSILSSRGCELLKKDGADIFYTASSMTEPFKELFSDDFFKDTGEDKPKIFSENHNTGNIRLPVRKKKSEQKNSSCMSNEGQTEGNSLQQEDRSVNKSVNKEALLLLSGRAQKIYEALSTGIADIETLVEKTGESVVGVQIALSELEAENLIKCHPGGKAERL